MFEFNFYLKIFFYCLCVVGFNLSMREYFLVKDVIKGGWGIKNKEDFKKFLWLLWCNFGE